MNTGISWLSIKTLLRLELRSRFGSRVETPVKTHIGRAVNILFTLIVYGILVLGIYYLAVFLSIGRDSSAQVTYDKIQVIIVPSCLLCVIHRHGSGVEKVYRSVLFHLRYSRNLRNLGQVAAHRGIVYIRRYSKLFGDVVGKNCSQA